MVKIITPKNKYEKADSDHKDKRGSGLRCLAKIIACYHTNFEESSSTQRKTLNDTNGVYDVNAQTECALHPAKAQGSNNRGGELWQGNSYPSFSS